MLHVTIAGVRPDFVLCIDTDHSLFPVKSGIPDLELVNLDSYIASAISGLKEIEVVPV
jgi:hypothetical protein